MSGGKCMISSSTCMSCRSRIDSWLKPSAFIFFSHHTHWKSCISIQFHGHLVLSNKWKFNLRWLSLFQLWCHSWCGMNSEDSKIDKDTIQIDKQQMSPCLWGQRNVSIKQRCWLGVKSKTALTFLKCSFSCHARESLQNTHLYTLPHMPVQRQCGVFAKA